MSSLRDRLAQEATEAGEFPDYPIVDFEVGTVVAGIIKRYRRVHTRFDEGSEKTPMIDVMDEERGEPVTVFLSATRLRSWAEETDLQPGYGVYIECYDTDPQQNGMKLFRAAIDKNPDAPPEPEPEPEQQSMDDDDVPF